MPQKLLLQLHLPNVPTLANARLKDASEYETPCAQAITKDSCGEDVPCMEAFWLHALF